MVQNPVAGRDPGVTVGISGDSSGLDSAIESSVAGLSKFKSAAASAGAAVGALGVAITGTAVNAARQFEEQMVDVKKVTSEAVSQELHTDIQQMAEEIPQSQSALSNIAETAGRLGVEGADNIQTFTRVVAEISTATNLASDDAANAFARIATLTNEPISNIRSLGDVVNRLSNSMAASAREITDSMTRASGTLTQLGLSTTQIAGLTSAMNEVSASSRRAGTQLRRLGQELQTVEAEKLAEPMGLTVEQFETLREENPNELIRLMAESMGEGGEAADALRSALSTTSRMAVAGLAQNLESLEEAQAKANEEMEQGGSLSEEFRAANSTFNASLQRLQNRLRNVGISIGERLLPPLSTALDYVSRGIAGFQRLNEKSDGLIGIFSSVGLAVGGLATSLGALAAHFTSVSAVTGAAGTALTALTGPLGLVIAAVGALAVAWSKNWGGIQDKTSTAMKKIRGAVKRGLRRIRLWWDKNGDDIVASARSSFNTAKSTVLGAMRFIWDRAIRPVLNLVSSAWDRHGRDITTSAREAFDNITSKARAAMNVLWGTILKPTFRVMKVGVMATLKVIRAAWDRWGEDIMRIVKGAFGTIQTVASIGLDALLTSVTVFLDILSGDWEGAWANISGFTRRTIRRIGDWLRTDAADILGGAIGIVVDAIKWPFEALYDWLFGNSLIKDLINDPAEWIKSTGKSKIGGAFDTLVGAIKQPFSGLSLSIDWPSLPGWLQDAMNKAGGGLQAAVEYVQSLDAGGGSSGGGGGSSGGGSSGGGSDDDDDGGGGGGGTIHDPPDPGTPIGGCFVADQLVATPEGPVPIGDLEAGDAVVSYDDEAGELTTSTIGEVIVHDRGEHDWQSWPLLDIHVEHPDGSTTSTTVTANHRYLTAEGWVHIGEVPIGTSLVTENGVGTLVDVEVREREPERVFNLHMAEGPHTYLVDDVVVHNAKLPALDSGGYINEAGAAILHAGERVVPAADVSRGGSSGGLSIERLVVHASSREEGRAAGQALKDELRSFDV